jgi:hypothetical protein
MSVRRIIKATRQFLIFRSFMFFYVNPRVIASPSKKGINVLWLISRLFSLLGDLNYGSSSWTSNLTYIQLKDEICNRNPRTKISIWIRGTKYLVANLLDSRTHTVANYPLFSGFI